MSSIAPRRTGEDDGLLDILGMTSTEFVEASHALGVPRGRAMQSYRTAFREGRADGNWFRIDDHSMNRREVEGETTKFTLDIGEDHETESVVIPMRGRRQVTTRTLCVSSQVGCAMGCGFCETAQMGLIRNLSAGQIVSQWWAATHRLEATIKNIVFMGMGEPMDNLDEVLQAIRILTDHNGPGVACANITISTVGRVDGIRRVADFVKQPGFHRMNLAISVNAPNDRIRSELMPINRAADMAMLKEALLDYPLRSSSAFCVEYVLIPGVNDADEHCDELCRWLEPIRCSLNVIPYNPRRDSPWPAPEEDDVERFIVRAIENGQFVKRRGTKGRDVMAACGQLGNPAIRRRRRVEPPAVVQPEINGTPIRREEP
ncbi:MAG: 23S rRNA (adenine(2503)-C(2))-methyltransferase RlmN [Phycisphaerales bacterium]|nr:23S rRNA (adenine(2503)-C(2))-methyltransferase RlmN [Phycisphaerales bacterium]